MSHDAAFESTRRKLVQALAGGAFMGATGAATAQALGRVPRPLEAGKSFYEIKGEVQVNGQPATLATVVNASDTITTGAGSHAIFVVGKDAFHLRNNSRLALSGGDLLVGGLRLLTGALVSVFGRSGHTLSTPTATIGIRGTGVYTVVDEEKSYFCTCYGVTELNAANSPANATQSEVITSRHHDAPRYILREGSKLIVPAPFVNHTDEELMLIEALVGRKTPFSLFDDSYGGPRHY
jgi:hypothetical protein